MRKKKEQFEKRNISKKDTEINRTHYKTGGKTINEMVGAFPIRSNNKKIKLNLKSIQSGVT